MQTETTSNPHAAIDERDAILSALRAFINSRPGLEFANYGDVALYRSEQRAITKDREHALTLLQYVTWTSIDAAALRAAFRDAYSGRLSLDTDAKGRLRLSYCTGQYYPTEYRRAACAVLASAIWAYWRDQCMPEPQLYRVESWSGGPSIGPFASRALAEADLASRGGRGYGHVTENYDGLSAGDYLRAKARAEFGRAIAGRWFN